MINFYDTSALLATNNNNYEEPFIISSITLDELNNLKDNKTKTSETRSKARQVLNWLDNNEDKYQVVLFTNYMLAPIRSYDFEITNDMKILACAMSLERAKEITFWCNDTAFRKIAQEFNYFAQIHKINYDKLEAYHGYLETTLTDDQLNDLYSGFNGNFLNLLPNEYLIVHDQDTGLITDRLCWTGKKFRHISYSPFKSQYMGEIQAASGDVYQQIAADSLLHNQITMITGKAGSGKSILSLSYALSELDAKRKDKLVIFYNPAPAKDAIQLGFYAGTKIDKLLDSSIGTILASKFKNGMDDVEDLIRMKKLEIVPLADSRGCDLNRKNAILYVTEAQNLSKYLMQIILQRASEDTQVIIEGDYDTQVDLDVYDNDQNGMRRLSDVFKGSDIFGQVDLQIIHRSKIAALAQQF